jgi:hypothetical protein
LCEIKEKKRVPLQYLRGCPLSGVFGQVSMEGGIGSTAVLEKIVDAVIFARLIQNVLPALHTHPRPLLAFSPWRFLIFVAEGTPGIVLRSCRKCPWKFFL